MLQRLRRVIPALCALTLCAAPAGGAFAQDMPSYARPASAQETISGRIIAVDGAFHLTLRDARGFVDDVVLRGATVINPTGLTLAPGMDVTIVGSNGGAQFDADEIDTTYSYDGDAPAPVYYGDGWWYPGFAYGYGPSFGLGFVVGSPYVIAHPFYGRPWRGGSGGYAPGNGSANGYHGTRRWTSTGPPPNPPSGDQRRSFGAARTTTTRMDPVTSGAQHHAEPVVYTVAPAQRSAPAAHPSNSTAASHR